MLEDFLPPDEMAEFLTPEPPPEPRTRDDREPCADGIHTWPVEAFNYDGDLDDEDKPCLLCGWTAAELQERADQLSGEQP